MILEGLVAAMLLVPSVAASGACSPIAIRATPADVAWRVSGVIRVQTSGNIAFVETQDHLFAIDSAGGTKLWEYAFHEESRVPEFVILEQRLAIVHDDRYVVFLDRATGERVGHVDAGEWIHHLAGPPLVAVTKATDSLTSTLLRMSDAGVVLGSRTIGNSTKVILMENVAIFEGDRDDEYELVAYHLPTLDRLWSEKRHTFNTQVIGDHLYVGDVFWSDGAHAIDPKTGATDALVPPRDPYRIGGSGEFDLQIVTSKWTGAWSPHFATCEGLRRNDPFTAKTRWQTDLPFSVSATLRDGETIYVAGSRDEENRFLVAMNWRTGRLQRAWSRVPMMSELLRAGDMILGFDLANDLVAIRLNDR